MSRIQDYQFGSITIDDQTYHSDVIVFPDRVDASWWRKEGHVLHREDLPFLGENPPEILIIGQGKFAMMRIAPEMEEFLNQLGIKWQAHPTGRAVEIYNEFWEMGFRNLIGAFHLTC